MEKDPEEQVLNKRAVANIAVLVVIPCVAAIIGGIYYKFGGVGLVVLGLLAAYGLIHAAAEGVAEGTMHIAGRWLGRRKRSDGGDPPDETP